jgi:hypothetical protein
MEGKARLTVEEERLTGPKPPHASFEHPATALVGAASSIRRHIAIAPQAFRLPTPHEQ